jgi:membrane protein required for colicin V production
MGIIDIFLAVLLGYGAYKGLKNGLFVEIASLISFVIGVYIAIKFSSFVATAIGGDEPSKTIKVTAFVITLIGVIVAIHLLAKIFSGIASFVFLGWLNKLGGAVFGTLKTALLLGIVLSLFQKVNIDDALVSKETQENSIFFNPILKTSEFMLPVLTVWFKDLKEKVSEKEINNTSN